VRIPAPFILLEESIIQQTEAANLHGLQGSSKSNIGIDQLLDPGARRGHLTSTGYLSTCYAYDYVVQPYAPPATFRLWQTSTLEIVILLVSLATTQHPEHEVMKQRFSSLDVKVENILSRSVKYVMLICPRLLLMSCLRVFVYSELQIFMICPQ
jgi:hypothetical protein